jgi:tetratricopeptide (TPR) repeat protein
MNLAQKMRVVACLSLGLLASAIAASVQISALPAQITQHERKLAEARATSSVKNEASELIALCSLYRQTGKPQKALEDCSQALSIAHRFGNRGGEALILNHMGRVYTDLGQEQKALELFNQTLPVWRELGIRGGEALTLNNLGRVYSILGEKQKALEFLNQALPIWRQVSNRSGEASTLDNIGRAYADMGQGAEALDYFNRALPIWREAAERGGEDLTLNRGGAGLTLNNMAKVYADLGQKQKSLEFYNRALVIWREIGNRPGEASALNYMGKVYNDLGQKQKALECFNQALPIWRDVGNRAGEALALNDIGRAYAELGQKRKALDFYSQALPIWREVGNRRGETATVNNMGRAYSDLGEKNKALEFDYQALSIWREVEDRRGEAFALSSIGRVYSDLGQYQQALVCKLAALSLAKDAGDPDIQGGIETSLMIDFRNQHRLEEAIFFGMDAVNSYQKIRKNISELDKDIQAGFAQSKSVTYRILAELLVQADRLGEAEQVLDLLKEQELKEVVRGAADKSEAKVEPLKLTAVQQKLQSELATPEKTAIALADLSMEYAALHAKAARTPEEAARLKTLDTKIEIGNGEVSEFFRKTLYPELASKAGTQDANALLSKEKSEVSRLQNTLAELGPQVMGIRLLMGEDHAYAIVVTAGARKKFVLSAAPAELRSKVLQVRDNLRTPGSDPKPRLAELYAMVVAPFAAELNALEKPTAQVGCIPTLLWSLDGVMRYVPMGALYDGHRYLVERFNNVLFTPESYGHMTASSGANSAGLRVLAMGLSKSYGGLPALPGVMPELDAVVRDPAVPESHGPMGGRLLPNEQFTLAALKTELGAGKSFQVVHIASHFVMETGSVEEPYLMLGGEFTGTAEG